MNAPLALPADLTELDQWVLWEYEDRSGKRTKVPKQPNHKPASATDPKTWRSYAEVVACEGFAGIGFVFDAGDPYVGIDLDNCLDAAGAVREWAIPYVTQFHDTYAEISPSGTGIKIFAKGRLPGRGKRKHFGDDHAIEVYDQGRFFTVTGNVFAGAPLELEEHQADIENLYRILAPDPAAKPKAGEKIKAGTGRWAYLLSLAGSMRRKGAVPDTIYAALVIENDARCDPPYEHRKLRQIADSSEAWPVVEGPLLTAAVPQEQPEPSPPMAVDIAALPETIEDCYAPKFIESVALLHLNSQFDVKKALRTKFGKDFHSREFERRVNASSRPASRDGESWAETLLTTDKGKPLAAVENALIAFRSSPQWRGVLNFDLSAMNIVVKCPPPWKDTRQTPFVWTDSDDTRATAWLEREGIMLKAATVAQAVHTVAQDYSFHPIRDYLAGLTWDGVERIDLWLETYLGVRAPDNVEITQAASTLGYIRTVAAKFLIGAIARVMQPGCKHDTCLILEGPQGARKSTALRTLFDPWFTDDMPDIHTKDASMQTRGVWLIEFGELDTLGKAEASRIKVFTSRAVDRFRPPYGRRVIECPRESVFAGTVNQQTWNKDETGGRRFWPIVCGAIDIESLKRDKAQLWAEALTRYNEPGTTWWLDDAAVVRESAEQQEGRYDADPWQDIIAPWLDSPRQRFLTNTEPLEPFTTTRDSTNALEVLLHAIGKRQYDITLADHARIGRSMRALRWNRRRVGSRSDRDWRYVRPIVDLSD